MNATECVTALGDGSKAFVVILSDDDCGHRSRRHELMTTVAATCVPSSQLLPPLPATAKAYKLKPRRKDRGAFVVLPEPLPVTSTVGVGSDVQATTTVARSSPSRQPPAAQPASGCVCPFRGHGFKIPKNGRLHASSPTSEPLRRQSSEPRIITSRLRRHEIKQRLSASTKDLVTVDGPTTTMSKPPPAPAMVYPVKMTLRKNKSSPRKPVLSNSLLSLGSSKTLKRSKPLAKRTITVKPIVAKKPTIANRPVTIPRLAGNRIPQKLSPRLPKKLQSTVMSGSALKTGASMALPKNVIHLSYEKDEQMMSAAVAVSTLATTTSNDTNTTMTGMSNSTSGAVITEPKTVATDPSTTKTNPLITETVTSHVPIPTTTALDTSTTVTKVTASTSAMAIATTHATNAVASALVDGGPIVTTAPPPAAIAANTLVTLSIANSLAGTLPSKPPQSTTIPRELSRRDVDNAVVVDMDQSVSTTTEPVTTQQSAAMITTTPPLSYELQEIVVGSKAENQRGGTVAGQLNAGTDNNKTLSTTNSSNGLKTVAWAR